MNKVGMNMNTLYEYKIPVTCKIKLISAGKFLHLKITFVSLINKVV